MSKTAVFVEDKDVLHASSLSDDVEDRKDKV